MLHDVTDYAAKITIGLQEMNMNLSALYDKLEDVASRLADLDRTVDAGLTRVADTIYDNLE